MINNMTPEVLIYIQIVKKFFNNDEYTKNYFLEDSDEEVFFNYLTDVAEKNFKTNGDPTLTAPQFEFVRKTAKIEVISKKEYPNEETKTNNIFMDIPNFGSVCLN